jgi:hypothetical protein
MERGWELINRSGKISEPESVRIPRETNLLGEIDPFLRRERWEFDSSLFDTPVVEIALVDDLAYNQEEFFLVNFDELFHPVIIIDTGSLNGGFEVIIVCWSFRHGAWRGSGSQVQVCQ